MPGWSLPDCPSCPSCLIASSRVMLRLPSYPTSRSPPRDFLTLPPDGNTRGRRDEVNLARVNRSLGALMSRLKRSTASSRAVIQGTTGSYALVDDISSDTEVVVSRADFVRLHVSEKRGGSSDGEDNAGKTHRLHKLHSFRRGEYRENAQVKFGAASFTGLAMASRVAALARASRCKSLENSARAEAYHS